MRFEISASDPNTGIVLNEDYDWHIEGAGIPALRRSFDVRMQAVNFAEKIHEQCANAEIWLTDAEMKSSEMLFDGLTKQDKQQA